MQILCITKNSQLFSFLSSTRRRHKTMKFQCQPFALLLHRKRLTFLMLILGTLASFAILSFIHAELGTGERLGLLRESGVIHMIPITLDEFGTERLQQAVTASLQQERIGKPGLHVHIWNELCLTSAQVLCDHPLTSMPPNNRLITRKLDIVQNKENFGQRIFGFLHPPQTGKYKFAIASDDSSELWLSGDEDSSNAVRICNVGERNEEFIWTERGDFNQLASQISKEIELQKGRKYFMEILHVQAAGDDFVQVAWRKPGTSHFEIIGDSSMSTFLDDEGNNESVPRGAACARALHHHQSTQGSGPTQYLPHEEVKDALLQCKHEQFFSANPLDVKRDTGEAPLFLMPKYYFPIDSYPPPRYKHVGNIYPRFREQDLDARTAGAVAKRYLDSLHHTYPGKFEVVSLINIEKKNGPLGDRFLLELMVNVKGQSESLILSEYVFMPKNSSTLCYPEGFQWNRKADIALVITAKNQGRWMVHFLNNLHQIYSATQDQHVSLVIFNYDDSSSDINLQHELDKRTLPPCKIVNYQAEHYSRSKSFNQAIKEVNDPHTIIFTVDLHLELPTSLFDDIRKHCFEGLAVYSPIIIRLGCGSLPHSPIGRWEPQGFGLIGIYKSDWDRIGGLNEVFDDKWGGEDWDLMQRVVQNGLEYERVRHKKIFHFFHTRKGLWTGDAEIQDIVSD